VSARAAEAAALLGADLRGVERLGGGDLSTVMRLTLGDGRRVIAKVAPGAGAEARMLRAIAAAGVPVPEVLAVAGDVLVMADLGEADGLPAGAALGAALRRLHDARAPGWAGGYGWFEDHAFGPVAIPNGASDDWPAFWAERRLLPSCPHLPAALARRVEALAARLPETLPATPAPALLHGDLWTGNVTGRGGELSGLIDPACYHGDAEVDLAMLALFGPALERDGAFTEAYGPLAPGHEARRAVYQLWPALVHLRLFGAGYRGLVTRCLEAAGA